MNKFIALMFFSSFLLASDKEKEKMMLKNKPLGAVYFTTNNAVARNYDFTPNFYFHNIEKPYNNLVFKSNEDEGMQLHLLLLEPGHYRIDGFFSKALEIPIINQGRLNYFFEVDKDKVNYLGRLILKVSSDNRYKLEAKDFFENDTKLLYDKKGSGYLTSKCLFSLRVLPNCNGVDNEKS